MRKDQEDVRKDLVQHGQLLEVLRRLQQPPTTAAQELHRLELGLEVLVVRGLIGGHTAVPNADGSVTIVLSRGMTSHPNSLTTLDYPRGNLAFRWFLADEVPARPEVRLVKTADAPTAVS